MLNFLTAAARSDAVAAASSRMLVGRRGDRPPYVISVLRLRDSLAAEDRAPVMVLVVDPEDRRPSDRDLAELFGLSPAEARLAAAIVKGKRLSQIAADSGVQITTLRTQVSSALRKIGVDRQADLVRLLTNIHGRPLA